MRHSRRSFLRMASATPLVAMMHGNAMALTPNGDLIVRFERDIANLDPANRGGSVDDNVLQACCQNLARFKPNSLEWEPEAAKTLTQVSDTEIAFELHSGLNFVGGYGEMTAEDVKFSLERFLPAADGSKPSYADDWAALDKVEVTGRYTGRILLKNPAPAIWSIGITSGSGTILCRKAVEELGDKLATTIVGTGPYMLSEWKPGDTLTLVKNPDYQGTDAPAFERILIKPIPEFRASLLAYRASEIDVTEIEVASMEQVQDLPDTIVAKRNSIDYTFISLNTAKSPLDNLKLRQGIRLGIDVNTIVAGAYSGAVERAKTLVAPGLFGHWDKAPVYERDVAAATALIAEAGASGAELTSTCLNDATSQAVAAIVQANLAEVGLNVTINALDSGAYWSMGSADASRDLELTLVTYGGWFDPIYQTQWFVSSQIGQWNWQRWVSAEYDELNKLAAITTDSAAREPMYFRMQELLDESASCIWITHGSKMFAHKAMLEPAFLPNGTSWQLRFFKTA